MKPVFQEFMHDPDNGVYGDCQRACIASLLELDRSEVPHFYVLANGNVEAFYDEIAKFMAKHGYSLKEYYLTDLAYTNDYCMIYGKSPRGENWHAVVADRNLKIVHDPHPSGAGLDESNKPEWIVAVMVPLTK